MSRLMYIFSVAAQILTQDTGWCMGMPVVSFVMFAFIGDCVRNDNIKVKIASLLQWV